MSDFDFDSGLIRNKKMIEILNLATAAAHSPAPLLLSGPSGSGKSSLARWIHQQGRLGRPLVVISAKESREKNWDLTDSWKEAKDGTLLIEEVDLSSTIFQQHLAALLEQKTEGVRPRVICTSRRELRVLARQEQFRQDLYYKITVLQLEIPALQDRKEDLIATADFILQVNSILHGKQGLRLSVYARERLLGWSWPGNIHELENVLERAVTLTEGPEIAGESIRFDETQGLAPSDLRPGMSLFEVEKRLILQTLELTAQNRTRAAQMLGISIRTLRNKLNEYKEAGAV